VRLKLEDAAAGARAMPTAAAGTATCPAGMQTEPQLEPATSAGVILPETRQFLMLCSLQLCQQLQLFIKLVQEYHCFFYTFYFLSAETVRHKRHVSCGSEQLQASARVKKLAAFVMEDNVHYLINWSPKQ